MPSFGDYLNQFRTLPESLDLVTLVTCIHPIHGVETFYLSLEDYQSNIMGVTRTFWANGYTIISQPAS